MSSSAPATSVALKLQFFDFLFPDERGNLCIAIGNASKDVFRQRWFNWPDERSQLGVYLGAVSERYNVWFGVTLFSVPERKRAYAKPGIRIWADLDEVDPFSLELPPSVVIESSPGRYQGIWLLSSAIPPEIAQDFSKRLAYRVGADTSGWDLEQLLRVPDTYNLKYIPRSEVKLLQILQTPQQIKWFETLPFYDDISPSTDGQLPMPGIIELPSEIPSVETVLEKYHPKIHSPVNGIAGAFDDLMYREPEEHEDWSARLWRLTNLCLELGMSEEETFSLAAAAKCNKYNRDNRPIQYLWKEVNKANQKQKAYNAANTSVDIKMPMLIDPGLVEEDSFVAEYKRWANDATDAPEQFHELSCFVALSAVVCNGLSLALPFDDNFRPNLWGLILGESTLSRKTTCMKMAMNLLTDLDPELILASDGSAEGLLTGLAGRPKRVSIFYKDEVSGFFDSINRKDYLAGFPETLTQLYDVPKILPRILRKETITVIEPYFIFFGGGIKDKVHSLINDDYILSGFLPRFLVVSSDGDISRIRRTGPPTSHDSSKKDALINRLADLKERYSLQVPVKIGAQTTYIQGNVSAHLTSEAWDFFGDKEEQLQEIAFNSPWQSLALPTFSRLAFSMLKMSLLIAASRRPAADNNTLEVNLTDLHQAAYYVQKWGAYSLDLLKASGISVAERMIERVLQFIRSAPSVTQSQIMQRFHMSSREMKEIRDTLLDRGLIEINKRGRGIEIKAFYV